jgi:hypothetical protein
MGSALSRGNVWIGLTLLLELALLPWTAHAYDAMAFLSHTDRVYFAHVRLTPLWAFGSISLAVLLLSQLPVLFAPALWNVVPLRIFLLKLPAWCADIGTAAIVRAGSADPQLANAWALRYLLDPAVVFVTVFHGQADALPNLFAVAGIALMLAEKYELAGLMFGLGTGTKFYPAAFVPLLVAVAYRRASWRRALYAFALFAVAAAGTLAPVVWGRLGSVVGAYANNSFGPEGSRVSTASLWTLVPPHFWLRQVAISVSPQIEQLIAVAIPVLLAIGELRHLPDRRDVARAAMLAAMSIVLLNPGAHPPFYLWIAGPLVLYAAVANDGLVSLAGVGLSCLSILTQFCQEGSDEYFLLNFGSAAHPALLRCFAPPTGLAAVALCIAAIVVVAAYRRELFSHQAAERCRRAAQVAAMAVFVAFGAAITVEAASAAANHPRTTGYDAEERAVNTFAIDPLVRADGDRCSLTYSANDVIVFAGNPFAARFATASLGYTLFSDEDMSVRGRAIAVGSLASTFENVDVRSVGQLPVRITREFDLTRALQPFRYVERFIERPCSLIRANPLLIYRFDFGAAQAAAAKLPLIQRLDVFARGGN